MVRAIQMCFDWIAHFERLELVFVLHIFFIYVFIYIMYLFKRACKLMLTCNIISTFPIKIPRTLNQRFPHHLARAALNTFVILAPFSMSKLKNQTNKLKFQTCKTSPKLSKLHIKNYELQTCETRTRFFL